MTFSFIQITDHHLTEADTIFVKGFSTRHALRAVLQHIVENVGDQADFLISTGDLVDRPTVAAYQAALEMLHARNDTAQVPGPLYVSAQGLRDFPVYFLPGNHDDRDLFFRCLFPKSAPAPFLNAAFMHKGIQFICLDLGPGVKATAHPEMLDFLARSLDSGAPSIIMTHHHLVPIGSRWLDDFIADGVDRFWDVVAGRNVLGVFSGHVHIPYEQVVHGIPVFGLRSTAFSFAMQDEPLACLLPPQYRLVTVEEGGQDGPKITTQVFDVEL